MLKIITISFILAITGCANYTRVTAVEAGGGTITQALRANGELVQTTTKGDISNMKMICNTSNDSLTCSVQVN